MGRSFKINVVGDGAVGKTNIIFTYINANTPFGYEPTILDYYNTNIEVDGYDYSLVLWDTAGQEDYDRLRSLSYYRTDCFLICFAIDSPVSYLNVQEKWAPEIKNSKVKVPMILVGTKTDLRDDIKSKCIHQNKGIHLKAAIGAQKYIECSAVTREGIENIFQEAIRAILGKKKKGNCNLL